MIKYKIFEQKSAMGEGDTRKTIYYPQIVDLSKMETTEFVDNIANLGSSAYSRGELQGVALDLGRAIAQMLINGNKVTIAGLGTFSPKLQTSQSNITDATEINKRYFSCDVTFKPSDDFKAILDKVNFVKQNSADADAGEKYTVSIENPETGVVTFTANKNDAFAGLEVDDIALKFNDASVEANDVTDNGIRVTNIEAGDYTIELTIPQHGDYARYSNKWNNVAVDGGAPAPGPEQITVQLDKNEAVTSVTGAGTYNIGDSVTISCVVPSANVFGGWYDNAAGTGTAVSTQQSYTFEASENVHLYAIAVPGNDIPEGNG